MKKKLCLLLALWMALTCLCAGAEGAVTPLDYQELPAAHRAQHDAAVADAIANAPFRIPGMRQLVAEARGEFNGYSGSKTAHGITLEYTVNDAMLQVGQPIKLNLKVTSTVQPMVFSISGLVMDTRFANARSFKREDGQIAGYTWEQTVSYTPTEEGYVNFVVTVSDENGKGVSITTSTVQVYKDAKPLFYNIAMDGDVVAIVLALDDDETHVGEVITATAAFMTKDDPVKYTGVWTLYDTQGNVLDESKTTGQCNAEEQSTTVYFDYWPMHEGEVRFVVTASDGAGNQAEINTPYVPVADGFFFQAELEQAAVSAGESLTGTYRIHGHECDSTKCVVGWTCYDPEDEDQVLYTVSSVVDQRAGTATFAPRYGQTIEFYVRASCEHYPDLYPANDYATLLYGIRVDTSLTAATVKSGSTVGLNYSVEDGLEPYQKILINGYSVDSKTNKTYSFLQQSVTANSGKVTGTPYLGDQVYYEVKVTEKDGYVSTWRSGVIPMTGAPEASAPELTASVDVETMELGGTVTLTYEMTGGSGTISKADPSASYVSWEKVDGTVAASKKLTKTSGTAEFTPAETGEYICSVVLTDGYHQRVSWTSDSIYVGNVRIPGDADDSGAAGLADAYLMIRHCADSSVTLNESNADVNADGKVDLNDALLMLQFSSGWGVKLK